jgi:hypothetical protein
MKRLLTIIFILCFISVSFSQTTAQFKESQYLRLDKNGFFVTVIGDTVRLKIEKKDGYILKTTGISISNGDTIIHQSKSETSTYFDFVAKEFGLSKQNRLYGDFVQENKILKFYPWKFTKSDSIGKKLEKYDYYVLQIPNRVVVKTKYSAWHYGILTLPVKVYTKSFDSISNTQFNANLNLMIGRKWGNIKYSYLAEKSTTPYSITKSINLIAGITELELTPSNTEKNLTKEIKVASLSYGLAFGFQYKKIGFFIASGFDTPLSKFGNDWVYKENLWIGLGFGLGL